MLRKVLKKDLQATSRYFLPLILGFFVTAILGKVLFEVGIVSSTSNDFIAMAALLFLSFYVLYLVAFYILTFVFLVIDFYKTMVGEQGYLTHTLPVSTSTLLNSKLLISIFWQLITGLLILLSLFLFAAGHMSSFVIQNSFTEFVTEFEGAVGISMKQYIGFMIGALVVSTVGSPLMFYVSIALGHLFGRQRVMGAILSYIGISSVEQIITTVVIFVMGYSFSNSSSIKLFNFSVVNVPSTPSVFGPMLLTLLWFAILFTVITSVIFYLLTHYIFKKKLNLE